MLGLEPVTSCPKGCLSLDKVDILVYDNFFPDKLADEIISKFEKDDG